ncbi:transcriptional regulator [Oceanimonas sp. NS1]|uniref:Anti-sigma-E factor RseA n=1 Tax=Oceanimonas doudoroffii TaxID=84158 RepID=A0A233RCJ6_9GAMM|nr:MULTISPECIES: RseA family anti-sigma factor [Oceanimonas]MCT7654952.1 transcriptional regulator [Oceanimonas sp. NS1]NHI00921.1 Anti-sigma-E factor RseA [Oceanimonas sp. MB9]OXY81113.1 transcriptional regulator [Oceanimonas doudoroffii]
MANKERISALVDGEIQDRVLLEHVFSDRELADTFGRYHLYGDVMRNELPERLPLDLSDSIAAALEQEAPLTAANDSHAESGAARVVRPTFGRALSRIKPALRHAGQFAIAASVSAAVIFGVQQYSQPAATQSPVLNTVPLSGGAAPVSLNYQVDQQQRVSEQQLLEQERRIHALLMDHELQQRLRQN